MDHLEENNGCDDFGDFNFDNDSFDPLDTLEIAEAYNPYFEVKNFHLLRTMRNIRISHLICLFLLIRYHDQYMKPLHQEVLLMNRFCISYVENNVS